MKVTILGSGTAVPSLTRNSAGVLLQKNQKNYLFDLGYGNLRQLLNLGITYHDIDRIFFTHNHPDHMCDLIMFLFGSRYHNDPRTKMLTITGGPGFQVYFETLMNAFKHWLIPTTYEIEIIEQDEETLDYDGLDITTQKVKHIEISRGYRITDASGKSIALSGDTDYCEGMVSLGRQTNLLILECSFPDNMKVGGHLTPKLAGKIAREAGCKQLCLTHFYPTCRPDEILTSCGKEFSGEIFLAEDLMSFDL